MRCWDVPQVLRLSRKRGNSSASASAGTTVGGRYEKRWRKNEGRGRKAAQPEPQLQPPEGDITGFQTISRSDRADCDNRPARSVRGITGEMRMSEYFRILRGCLTVLLPANMPKLLPHSTERLYRG